MSLETFREYLDEAKNITIGKEYKVKIFNAATNKKEETDVTVVDFIKSPGTTSKVVYKIGGKTKEVAVGVFKNMMK